jgi:hypothetical protein
MHRYDTYSHLLLSHQGMYVNWFVRTIEVLTSTFKVCREAPFN